MVVFVYLTPFIPLSLRGVKGEGGNFVKRGAGAPLKHPPSVIPANAGIQYMSQLLKNLDSRLGRE